MYGISFIHLQLGMAAFESGHVVRIDSRMRNISEEFKITSDPCKWNYLKFWILVISFATDPNAHFYASGGLSNEIIVGEWMDVATRRSIHLPNEGILSLSIRNDSKLLAAGGKDGK